MALKNNINTYADMTAYNADSTKEYPNISYIIATDEVVWMESEPIIPKAIYNVTSTSLATTLLNSATGITKQIIDGVEQSSVVTQYTFNTTGEHVVEYEYANNEISDRTFRYCDNLTSIIIPDSVTSIGQSVFRDCPKLTTVTIGNGVTIIADNAFRNCWYLTTVTIGKSVTDIGGWAFQDCSSLTSINIPNSVTSIGYNAFYNCVSLPVENNIRYADTCAVLATDNTLSTYTIKEGTRFIGSNAFSGCTNLTSITIPNSVTRIGNYAFNGCTNLTSITIPNSVTRIGNYAFQNCTNLTSVTIGNSVTYIGIDAFSGCTSLPVENNIRYADTCAVLATDNTLSTYTIKEGTRFIGTNAFYKCTNLTSITLPDSVISIGVSAFKDSGLTSINIPNGVTTIGNYAFQDCKSLASINIPNSVTNISEYAFRFCSSLTNVTVEATTPPTLGSDAFANNASGRKIYVPAASVSTYQSASGWSDYASDIEAIS